MALLAATCSKIGVPSENDNAPAIPQQQQPLFRVVNAVQNPVYQAVDADLLTSPSWVQVPGFGAMQSTPAAVAAPPGTVTVTPTHQAAPAIIQNQNTQVIATPVTGPGGTIAYNLIQNPMPQFHTITIVGADGAEQQVIVPASSLQLSQNLVAPTPAQNPATAFLAPNGQLIATPTGLTMAGNSTLPVGGLSTLANFAPGNVVNLGGLQNMAVARQGGMMQAMQLQTPQVQTVPIQIQNTAGLMQTIHMPLQAMQTALQPMAGLTPQPGTPGVVNVSPKQQVALATQYTGAATPQQTNTALSSVASLSSNNQTTIAIPQSANPGAISQPTSQPTILSVPVVGSTASCVAMTTQPSNKTASGALSAAAGTSKLLYTTPSSTATNISGAPAADILSMATANILNPTTPSGLLNNIPSYVNPQQVPGMAAPAQTVQNIILPTGQIVQSLASPVITGMQNIQVVGQNGQMIQAQWLAPMASNVPRPASIPQLQGLTGLPNLQTYGIQPTFLNTNALLQNIPGATPAMGIQQLQQQAVLAQQGIDPSQVVTTAASQQNPVLCKYVFRIQSFEPWFGSIFIERSLVKICLDTKYHADKEY